MTTRGVLHTATHYYYNKDTHTKKTPRSMLYLQRATVETVFPCSLARPVPSSVPPSPYAPSPPQRKKRMMKRTGVRAVIIENPARFASFTPQKIFPAFLLLALIFVGVVVAFTPANLRFIYASTKTLIFSVIPLCCFRKVLNSS